MSAWRPVFLVLQIGQDPKDLQVRELEGYPIENSGTWAINMRAGAARYKFIEVVDERYVHATREAAEAKREGLKKERAKR